jgi:hypothetical protein
MSQSVVWCNGERVGVTYLVIGDIDFLGLRHSVILCEDDLSDALWRGKADTTFFVDVGYYFAMDDLCRNYG